MLSQQLVNGLVLGSTYALFALGFTLIFGVLRVINLTYGFYFSVGAFVALWLARSFGASIWIALPLGSLAAGLVAVVVDGVLLTRLRRTKAGELPSLMVTLGAVLALYSLMAALIGTDIQRFPFGFVGSTALEFAGIRVSLVQMLIVGTAFVLVAVLFLLLQHTRLGLMIRALAENEDAARLMGINVDATVVAVSFLSGLLGGAAGVLIGLNFNAIQPFMGEAMMLRGFAVIIIGGLGDIRGALVAGILLGVLEVLTAGYLSSNAKEAVGFTILVLTLWFRPVGLFGRAQVKRA
ncbi:branched-chain amino acid ABC transporter permease [Azospirillum doebereinerae]|uniref:Branched-chain amino acid ABC transporter permease n=1 Tax=Azospirillum doebereinerae TaxID=92933 RepID=A0A433JD73_9PROT|nr:branched-chain amino acid ABC transporter permease [Azospirillum doebereinerae]MCG5238463.1 branched-chain amino acid ABC transporter permease [Azospirillum doebereinerae]RUQ74545.1 branched-chain amino acid ABC transporter permease [Azospirillum doebereinerae]